MARLGWQPGMGRRGPWRGVRTELWYCLGGTLGRAERIPVSAISPERERNTERLRGIDVCACVRVFVRVCVFVCACVCLRVRACGVGRRACGDDQTDEI